LIEGSYLESIVKELIAARERIAELEAVSDELNKQLLIDRHTVDAYRTQNIDQANQIAKQQGIISYPEDGIKEAVQQRKEAQEKLAKAIIPQAGDADMLKWKKFQEHRPYENANFRRQLQVQQQKKSSNTTFWKTFKWRKHNKENNRISPLLLLRPLARGRSRGS
jgi:hypothetical protein